MQEQVPLLEHDEAAAATGGDFSVTSAPSSTGNADRSLSVTSTSGASPSEGPSITFYRADGSALVIDRETLTFWLAVAQTVALLVLVYQEVRD